MQHQGAVTKSERQIASRSEKMDKRRRKLQLEKLELINRLCKLPRGSWQDCIYRSRNQEVFAWALTDRARVGSSSSCTLSLPSEFALNYPCLQGCK